MCGISGFIGMNAPTKALVITLGQLERGTQGSGLAYLYRNAIRIQKSPKNPINHLLEVNGLLPNTSTCAIAHNRLPSKGKVTYVNTHPFLACNRQFALVHNGHMFNGEFEELVKALGHRVQGDTDSEVLCHWLEELISMERSIVKALLRLEDYGFSGAILLLTKNGVIYGLRDSTHPLYIAKNKNEIALASTKNAIKVVFEDQREFMEPKPYQVVKIANGRIRLIGEGKQPQRTQWEYAYDYEWWKNNQWYF